MQPLGENTSNTPAFLGKLWKMVNDPSTDNLICWSPSGTSFVIPNQAQFWYELLPLYYKHNNMSSFVRQLNMYGFHKMSTVENGTMDSDKDEIQFSHPYFIKDKPELLRMIKRKAATSKGPSENPNNKHEDLGKVLNDVKQLRGRQTSVDNQLNAMKQENALLWREVAILRQKHIKQQKIVNKLIQFLVTLVQPSRMTVGVKRGYQLMLNESPNKKMKTNNNQSSNTAEGPTIHELDSELDLASNLYEDDAPVVNSPTASSGSQQTGGKSPISTQIITEENSNESFFDKPDFVALGDVDAPDEINLSDQENLIKTLESEPVTFNTDNVNNEKVFLNPSTQDTLLSNLMKTNTKAVNSTTNGAADNTSTTKTKNDMTIATRDPNFCDIKSTPSTSEDYSSDLTNHIESAQNEIEQFKDILNGYTSFDANTLLGELHKIPQNIKDVYLFNDDSPLYDLNISQDLNNDNAAEGDPLLSGSEITPYASNFDLAELLDESLDGENASPADLDAISSTINTPQVHIEEPTFPAIAHVQE